jgi:hypothetical protein
MSETLVINRRFNGPPGSGNGGYVCGVMAKLIDSDTSTATLRAPPPLETPLAVARDEAVVRLMHGDTVVAEAHRDTLALTAPPAPSLDEAKAARRAYGGLHDHRYPTCFVCGTARDPRDGLELFTGAVDGRKIVACDWAPGDDLFDGDRLNPAFIHAALDCPSYWALPRAGAMAALLAKMTTRVDGERPRLGEPLIVAAWALASEGRKHRAASALYGKGGRVVAVAEALWIEPRAAA